MALGDCRQADRARHRRSAVKSVAYSPHGTTLASGTDNGNVMLFPFEYRVISEHATIAVLCSEVRANLAPSQWRQYVTGEPYQTICPGYPRDP